MIDSADPIARARATDINAQSATNANRIAQAVTPVAPPEERVSNLRLIETPLGRLNVADGIDANGKAFTATWDNFQNRVDLPGKLSDAAISLQLTDLAVRGTLPLRLQLPSTAAEQAILIQQVASSPEATQAPSWVLAQLNSQYQNAASVAQSGGQKVPPVPSTLTQGADAERKRVEAEAARAEPVFQATRSDIDIAPQTTATKDRFTITPFASTVDSRYAELFKPQVTPPTVSTPRPQRESVFGSLPSASGPSSAFKSLPNPHDPNFGNAITNWSNARQNEQLRDPNSLPSITARTNEYFAQQGAQLNQQLAQARQARTAPLDVSTVSGNLFGATPTLPPTTPLLPTNGTVFSTERVPQMFGGQLSPGPDPARFQGWVNTLPVPLQATLGVGAGVGSFVTNSAAGVVGSVSTALSGGYGLLNTGVELMTGRSLPGAAEVNDFNAQVSSDFYTAGGNFLNQAEKIINDPIGQLVVNPYDNAAVMVANGQTFELSKGITENTLNVAATVLDVGDLIGGLRTAAKGGSGVPSFSLDTTGLRNAIYPEMPTSSSGGATTQGPAKPSGSHPTGSNNLGEPANQVLSYPRRPPPSDGKVLVPVGPKAPPQSTGVNGQMPPPLLPNSASRPSGSEFGNGSSGPKAIGGAPNNPTGGSAGQPQPPGTPSSTPPINTTPPNQAGTVSPANPQQAPTTGTGGPAVRPPRTGEMLEDDFVALYNTRPFDAMQEALMRSTPTSNSRLDNGVPIDREVILRDANGDIAARVLIRRDEGSFSHGMGDHLNFEIQLAQPNPRGSFQDPATGQIVTPNVLRTVPGSNLHILFGDPTRPRFPTDLGVNRGRNQGVDWYSQRDPAAHAADQVRARDEYDRLYGAAAASTATLTASANVTNAISSPPGRTTVGNYVLDFTTIGSSASSSGNVGLASDLTGDMRLRGFNGFDPNRPQLPLLGAVVGMGSNAPVGLPTLNVPAAAAPHMASAVISEAFANPSSRPMIDRDGIPFGASSSGGNFAIDRNGPTFTSEQFVLRPAGLPTGSVVSPQVPGVSGTPQLWSQLDAARPTASADLANQFSNPISRPGVEGQGIEFGAPSSGRNYAIDNNSGITFRPGQVRLDTNASSAARSTNPPNQVGAKPAVGQQLPDPYEAIPEQYRPALGPGGSVPNLSNEAAQPLASGNASRTLRDIVIEKAQELGETLAPGVEKTVKASGEVIAKGTLIGATASLAPQGYLAGSAIYEATRPLVRTSGDVVTGANIESQLANYIANPKGYLDANYNGGKGTNVDPTVLFDLKSGETTIQVPGDLYKELTTGNASRFSTVRRTLDGGLEMPVSNVNGQVINLRLKPDYSSLPLSEKVRFSAGDGAVALTVGAPNSGPQTTTFGVFDGSHGTEVRKEVIALGSFNGKSANLDAVLGRVNIQTNTATIAQGTKAANMPSGQIDASNPNAAQDVTKAFSVVAELGNRVVVPQVVVTKNGPSVAVPSTNAYAELAAPAFKREANFTNVYTGDTTQISGLVANQPFGFSLKEKVGQVAPEPDLDPFNMLVGLSRQVSTRGTSDATVLQKFVPIPIVDGVPMLVPASKLPSVNDIGPSNKPFGQKRSSTLDSDAMPNFDRLALSSSGDNRIAFGPTSPNASAIDPQAFSNLDFSARSDDAALNLPLDQPVNRAASAALDAQEAKAASASGGSASSSKPGVNSGEVFLDVAENVGSALGANSVPGQAIAGTAGLVKTIGKTNTDGVEGNAVFASGGFALKAIGDGLNNPVLSTAGAVSSRISDSMVAGTARANFGQKAEAAEAVGNTKAAADFRTKESQAGSQQTAATVGIVGDVLGGVAKLTGSKELGTASQVVGLTSNAIGNFNNGVVGDGALNLGTGAAQIVAGFVPGVGGKLISSGASIVKNAFNIAKGGFSNVMGGIGGIATAISSFIPGTAGKVVEWAGMIATTIANPIAGLISMGMKMFGNTRKGALGDHASDIKADFNGDGVKDLLTVDNDMDVKIKQGYRDTVQFDPSPIRSKPTDRGSFVTDGLAPGQVMTSANGKYAAVYSKDGLLAVYEQGDDPSKAKAIWGMPSTMTQGIVAVQADGLLTGYNESPRGDGMMSIWQSAPSGAGNGPHYLSMGDDGNLVMYKGVPGDISTPVWGSKISPLPEDLEPNGYVQVAKFDQEGYLDKASQLEGVGLQDVNNDGKLDFVFPDAGMTLMNESTLKDVSFYDKGQRDHADALAAKMKSYAEAPVLDSVIAVAKPRGGFELKDTTATSRNRGANAAGEIVFAGKQIEGWVTIKRPDNTLARVAIGMMGGSEDEGATGYAASGTGAKWLAANRLSATVGAATPVGAASATNTQTDAATANAFVTQAYQEVLGRAPDSGGLAANVNALTAGALSITQVRENLLNSAERQAYVASQAPVATPTLIQAAAPQAQVAAPIVNPQIAQADAQVTQAYQEILGRIPDEGGRVANRNALLAGTSLDQVRVNLLGSAERQTYLNNQLTAMYKEVLRRDPDAGGLAANLASINGGAQTLAQVRQNLLDSTERKVVNAYQDFLNRAPDPVGLQYWWGLMNSGQMNEAQMRTAISESALIEKRAA
jgi:hypothetical protein